MELNSVVVESLKKMKNKSVIVVGSRHSGKRSPVDSLVDKSKTNIYTKKSQLSAEKRKKKP